MGCEHILYDVGSSSGGGTMFMLGIISLVCAVIYCIGIGYKIFKIVKGTYQEEDEKEDNDGAQDGDGEGSETGKDDEKGDEEDGNGDEQSDHSKSSDGTKEFEFINKD